MGTVEVDINASGGMALLEALAREIDTNLGEKAARSPGELVLGLPLNMDGTEGPRAKQVRSFAALLASRAQREVRFQDERLTTADADWQMARTGMTHKQKKMRRDALSAANILRDFLATLQDPPAASGDDDPGTVNDA